jgi:hypothetical protein
MAMRNVWAVSSTTTPSRPHTQSLPFSRFLVLLLLPLVAGATRQRAPTSSIAESFAVSCAVLLLLLLLLLPRWQSWST